MKVNPLATALVCFALVTAMVPGATSRAATGRPSVGHVDGTYQDVLPCGIPVEIHYSIVLIFHFGADGYTELQRTSLDWTNLQNGKTVTSLAAGNFTQSFTGDFPNTFRGTVLIMQGPGQFVDAGLVEIVLTYDPVTDTYPEVTVKSVGNHPGDFNDALCAALQ